MSPADLVRRPAGQSLWFPRAAGGTPPGADAVPRLVCLPHAGGTPSVYGGWQEELGDGVAVVPVLLPGRGLRLREEPHTALAPLARDLAAALVEQRLAHDYVLFGHSMGALLAYEVACQLRDLGRTEPLHLFVSGSRAPHLYGDRSDHTLPDAELHRLVRDLGGLGADHEVGAAYLARRLPVLRADLHACDTYRWRPRRPLRCPMTAFSADDDPIAPFGHVEAWRAYTTSSFLHRHLTGGHFFLGGGAPRSRLLRELRAELGRVRGATDTGTPASPSSRNRSWTC
ncbi:alpha/beta fold hydrolase [Streptomyces sp. NPDC013178]|uniref:thioesterase II family protein n=1 Tax=Streptomyces sp. NPDC013178 TaxID=3155118 RepID=UPI0033DDCDC3